MSLPVEREASLLLSLLLPFGRVAQHYGPDVAATLHRQVTELLGPAGLERDGRPVAELRVPHGLVAELLRTAIDVTGDPALALHAGASVEVGDFGEFEYMLRSCATLGEAFEVGAQHIAMLHDAAPCHFGADYNAFVVPREATDLRLPTADPALFRMMKRKAGEVLAKLPRRQPFRSRVREAIDTELARSGASLKSVARRLELSQSTLRRRLRERGITYAGLVDEVRRERACELLTTSQDSLESIALQTGFSHATALHRAFRRWYGITPERFRKGSSREL